VVRESLSTRAAIVKNTEVKCKSIDPDWHPPQVCRRRQTGEYVLFCDGSLKELAISTDIEGMLICKQLLTVTAGIKHLYFS
jgi:hypothetical protein